jgi:RNA polymerase sigma-70 factor (ECF subfamily)
LAARLHHAVAEITPDPAALSDATAIIRQGLATLSDDDRELIMLIAWDGLEPREAAIVLGVPARTVRTRLHRARARLHKLIGDAFDSDGQVQEQQHPRPAQEDR